jgi:hypothetical protein
VRLLAAVEKMFAAEFEGRILPFDEDAAGAFAKIVAARAARTVRYRNSMP